MEAGRWTAQGVDACTLDWSRACLEFAYALDFWICNPDQFVVCLNTDVVRTHVRTYVTTHVRTYVRTHLRAYVRTYVMVRAYVCTYVRTDARTYVRRYVLMYVRTRARTHVRT